MAMHVDPTRVHPFATRAALGAWFARHHAQEPELWVKLSKVGTGVDSVRWEDCVLEALTWGWIDAIRKSFDDVAYLQRLTPRTTRSIWSLKNCGHAEQLIADGHMQPTGLAQVQAAKADGRWERAYAGPADMVMPDEFLTALAAVPLAQAMYDGLDKRNRFAIYLRLQTAKRAETRARRTAQFVEQLARGETIV